VVFGAIDRMPPSWSVEKLFFFNTEFGFFIGTWNMIAESFATGIFMLYSEKCSSVS